MTQAKAAPLAPFVDALPLPSRLIAVEHDGRPTVGIRASTHQFHRDLPSSSIWGFEGTVPGPTIEAERGQPVTIEWRNELQARSPSSTQWRRCRPTRTAYPCSAFPA
jgi:spore coat protein A